MTTRQPPVRPTPGERSAAAERATRYLVYCVALGFFVACAWYYRKAFYMGVEPPRNTFLFSPGAHFGDLIPLLEAVDSGDPHSANLYFPFSNLVLEPFTWLRSTDAAVAVLGAITVGGLGAFLSWCFAPLRGPERAACALLLILLSYPFLFVIDRSNIEVIVVVAFAAFAWAVATDRRWVAVAAISIAIAVKGYPAVFLLVFLIRRDWGATAASVVAVGVLTLLGTVYYDFDVLHVIDLLRKQQDHYHEFYAINDQGLAYGSSLWGAIKVAVVDVGHGDVTTVSSLMTPYTVGVLLLFAGLALAIWRLELDLWEQLMLLAISTIVLTPVSADYKLLHLLVPIGLFLRGTTRMTWWPAYVVLFALLLVPKSYYVFRDPQTAADGASISIVLNPLLMTIVCVVILVDGVRRRRAGAAAAPERHERPVTVAA